MNAALITTAMAIAVAAASFVDLLVLLATLGVLVLLVGVGWARLLELPDPRGTALTITVTGWVGLAVTYDAYQGPRSLSVGIFSGLIAFAVIVAFLHEMLRRGSRERLMDSLSGTLTGQVLVLLTGGWVLLPMTSFSSSAVVMTVTALAAVRLAGVYAWKGSLVIWGPFVVGAIAGFVPAVVLGYVDLASVLLAVAVAGVVAGIDRLLAAQPASRTAGGMLTGAAAPLAAIGTVAYSVAVLVAG